MQKLRRKDQTKEGHPQARRQEVPLQVKEGMCIFYEDKGNKKRKEESLHLPNRV